MKRLKDEEYKGRKVVFVRKAKGLVFAQVPSIGSQFLGNGRTKEEAFESAKQTIDHLLSVNKALNEGPGTICEPDDLPNDDAVKEYRKSGKILRIYVDRDPESPREWDNVGIMVTAHRKYDLGDEQLDTSRFSSWDEAERLLRKERDAVVILPLYLYDHGGLSINTTGFASSWDSGQVGFIYTNKEQMERMGVLHSDERIKKFLKDEVATYNQYLTGDVYGFKLFECIDGRWQMTDSTWGYYGDDPKENGIFDATGETHWREQ